MFSVGSNDLVKSLVVDFDSHKVNKVNKKLFCYEVIKDFTNIKKGKEKGYLKIVNIVKHCLKEYVVQNSQKCHK